MTVLYTCIMVTDLKKRTRADLDGYIGGYFVLGSDVFNTNC